MFDHILLYNKTPLLKDKSSQILTQSSFIYYFFKMLLVSCKWAALNLIVIVPLGVSEPPEWNMCDIFGKDDSAPYVTILFCIVLL